MGLRHERPALENQLNKFDLFQRRQAMSDWNFLNEMKKLDYSADEISAAMGSCMPLNLNSHSSMLNSRLVLMRMSC